MNEVWKFLRVSYEKDWCIVANEVVVALLGVKLYGKATRIPLRVR
jgi:hypothetical protein